MQALKNITLGILIGLIAAAAVLFVASPPHGTEVTLLPTSTLQPLTVHFSGAVATPGLLTLAPGSRVADAVELAGGFLPDALITNINLAQRLIDGQQIYVPSSTEESETARSTLPVDAIIDLNTATAEQLDQLPGIGLTKAEAIIDHRQKIGGFDKIEQILEVTGIGPALFDQIKDRISVTPMN